MLPVWLLQTVKKKGLSGLYHRLLRPSVSSLKPFLGLGIESKKSFCDERNNIKAKNSSNIKCNWPLAEPVESSQLRFLLSSLRSRNLPTHNDDLFFFFFFINSSTIIYWWAARTNRGPRTQDSTWKHEPANTTGCSLWRARCKPPQRLYQFHPLAGHRLLASQSSRTIMTSAMTLARSALKRAQGSSLPACTSSPNSRNYCASVTCKQTRNRKAARLEILIPSPHRELLVL